ncbi:MAG: MBL fold metallo-hydrolase [Tannerella sp.]|jgi:glyoxylase-like metal-dependent hydrolase (beta-lactamase superfamily II)|nr:MBL fold metallo-hydrolase [Tannerella sp.]
MAGNSFQLINTGYFYADGGSMFGAIPQQAWSRRYPADGEHRCRLAMHVGLVRTQSGRVILIDTGVGDKQLEQLRSTSYHFHGLTDLREALRERGISPGQVTDIVLTHLHFDHCGYVTRKEHDRIVPAFPEAICRVSRLQWENALHPHPLEADSYFPENMEALEKAGKLQLVQADCDLCEGVRLRLCGGHTSGQIVAYVQTDKATAVFVGDVIPIAAQVSPLWISAYDVRPLISYDEKIRLLDEAAANHQLIVHYHDAYTPCSTVRKINNFYKSVVRDERFVTSD